MRHNLLLARDLLTDIPLVTLSFSGDHEGPHYFYNWYKAKIFYVHGWS